MLCDLHRSAVHSSWAPQASSSCWVGALLFLYPWLFRRIPIVWVSVLRTVSSKLFAQHDCDPVGRRFLSLPLSYMDSYKINRGFRSDE